MYMYFISILKYILYRVKNSKYSINIYFKLDLRIFIPLSIKSDLIDILVVGKGFSTIKHLDEGKG